MPLAEFLLLNAVLLTLLNIAPGDDARTCSWEVQRECESKQPLKTLLISVPDAAAHHKGLHGRRRRRGVPHRACHRRTCSMPPAPRSPSHRTAPRTGPVSCPRACRPASSYSQSLGTWGRRPRLRSCSGFRYSYPVVLAYAPSRPLRPTGVTQYAAAGGEFEPSYVQDTCGTLRVTCWRSGLKEMMYQGKNRETFLVSIPLLGFARRPTTFSPPPVHPAPPPAPAPTVPPNTYSINVSELGLPLATLAHIGPNLQFCQCMLTQNGREAFVEEPYAWRWDTPYFCEAVQTFDGTVGVFGLCVVSVTSRLDTAPPVQRLNDNGSETLTLPPHTHTAPAVGARSLLRPCDHIAASSLPGDALCWHHRLHVRQRRGRQCHHLLDLLDLGAVACVVAGGGHRHPSVRLAHRRGDQRLRGSRLEQTVHGLGGRSHLVRVLAM